MNREQVLAEIEKAQRALDNRSFGRCTAQEILDILRELDAVQLSANRVIETQFIRCTSHAPLRHPMCADCKVDARLEELMQIVKPYFGD